MSDTNTPEQTKPSETYPGSCHCGRVKYNAIISPPLTDPECSVMECNCSICARNGHLFVYLADDKVIFEKGSIEDLTKYTFGAHKMGHFFCPVCGTNCFSRSVFPGFYDGMTAVNVRALHDVDLKKLTLKQADGKSYKSA
ncbi:hypothetical protein P154DRAFT_527489 [Amniculicola lignicola CBS 123094]|uniref:CENP-V/GFA domain-containing protein n=1 Tax=Amniculicola lignicola CBS 123094 TaxID=1392246 RepID=A0A6A5VW86_9PLEO|nr:hypothetical protein P154DRAFT_527489 [Amniculicola lignicola CBS 123094]